MTFLVCDELQQHCSEAHKYLIPMLRQAGSTIAFAFTLLTFQVLQTQTHMQQIQQQQPGSSRSLSFLSSAGALQRSAGTTAAAASPIQQLNHTQRLLPLSWQQTIQQQQQHCEMLPLLQHMPGQQLRHFVLMPRRVKYRKAHKSMGFNETVCGNTRQLAFGLYGIRALEHCRMPAATLEAVR
jgi:hypothetical protein